MRRGAFDVILCGREEDGIDAVGASEMRPPFHFPPDTLLPNTLKFPLITVFSETFSDSLWPTQ